MEICLLGIATIPCLWSVCVFSINNLCCHKTWIFCSDTVKCNICFWELLRLSTHWGRVTHICVGNLTTIGSYIGLSPGRRQAIIWTNAGILLNESLRTDFSEILIEILTFSFKKTRLKVSSVKWRPFCIGPDVYITSNVTHWSYDKLNMDYGILWDLLVLHEFIKVMRYLDGIAKT